MAFQAVSVRTSLPSAPGIHFMAYGVPGFQTGGLILRSISFGQQTPMLTLCAWFLMAAGDCIDGG